MRSSQLSLQRCIASCPFTLSLIASIFASSIDNSPLYKRRPNERLRPPADLLTQPRPSPTGTRHRRQANSQRHCQPPPGCLSPVHVNALIPSAPAVRCIPSAPVSEPRSPVPIQHRLGQPNTMSSFRPLLRKSFSSNDESPASSSAHHTPGGTPTPTPPPISTHSSFSHISIQLPTPDQARPPMDHKPHSAMAGGGAGFPRTRTNSSGAGTGEGRYRRKVGFEAFEAGPAAMFAYTCQVSCWRESTNASPLQAVQSLTSGQERGVQAVPQHASVCGRCIGR